MSTHFIFIIAGTLLSLYALLGGLASNQNSGILRAKVRVPFGLLGILLIIYGGYAYGSTNSMAQIERAAKANIKPVDYPVTSVEIISPVRGDLVECRTLTMGVYPEPHSKDIWVLLKPSDGKYYPQSDHTNTSYKRNGKWQVITRYGGDKGEQFEIIAFEAEPEASAFFSETIESWKSDLNYPGLEEENLPEGITEVDRIVVSLAENCRGIF